ncbi:hypothetical protein [Buttiauxella sp. B2]|nr:hypothetical protein [Buttiauxella sp. B2]
MSCCERALPSPHGEQGSSGNYKEVNERYRAMLVNIDYKHQ